MLVTHVGTNDDVAIGTRSSTIVVVAADIVTTTVAATTPATTTTTTTTSFVYFAFCQFCDYGDDDSLRRLLV